MTYDEIGFFVFGNVKKYKKHRIFMNEQKRLRNEKEYDKWIEQPNGGRIYSFEIVVVLGGYQNI